MSSAITTTLPLLYDGNYVAEVIGAEATATTYVLNCNEHDLEEGECGTFNNTVAVGPWGSKTLPPGAASTGYLDYFVTMPYEEEPFLLSMHCKMSRTIAQECTTTNIGGNNDGTPTATYSDLEKSQTDFAFLTYATVTITAGQEFLAATHSAATTADDASSTAKSASGATSADEASAEATGTETQGTPTPKSTSGASLNIVRGFAAMAVAGIATLLVSS
ncbi:hypothetical protein CEP54_006450 [Fusarium duplospermum]|uniref:Uncharacterized protein n=1 Tax=Fusarium duplospermum TaxID=1325734 RepID=A0A428Q6N9_9HYPO|nr:hypothetical protein CEP54_006450 [Fusarium duplospermum]